MRLDEASAYLFRSRPLQSKLDKVLSYLTQSPMTLLDLPDHGQGVADLLDRRGRAVGAKICQDWSGPRLLSLAYLLSAKERDVVHCIAEHYNSNGVDYCPGEFFTHDEMVASFAMSAVVRHVYSVRNVD